MYHRRFEEQLAGRSINAAKATAGLQALDPAVCLCILSNPWRPCLLLLFCLALLPTSQLVKPLSSGCSPNFLFGDNLMYSPAIINPEQAFQPLQSGSDRLNLVLPLQSFFQGNPSLVEISPCSGLGPTDLNTYDQGSSLLLNSNLSAQTDHHPLVFWSTPNFRARSRRWI